MNCYKDYQKSKISHRDTRELNKKCLADKTYSNKENNGYVGRSSVSPEATRPATLQQVHLKHPGRKVEQKPH